MPGDRPDPIVDRAYQVGAFATAAVLAPAPPADRRDAIRAAGIVQIVLGGICGALALFVFAAAALGSNAMTALAGLVYTIPAANLLLTGIGSVRIARWARRATLISAFVWLGLALMAAGGLVLMGGRGRGNGYERVMAGAIVVVALALAILLIAVYTRPSVRATFERRQVS